MKVKVRKLTAGALLCALAAPAAAMADEQATQKKIDELTRKVERLEDKSLGKWLTIGGDYRFRVDSLRGEVPAHSNAIGTMGNLVNGFVNGDSVGSNAVAGTTVGANPATAITNPSAAAYMFQGQSGSLFSPAQFETILNKYMPSAMYNGLVSDVMPRLGAMTPAQVSGYLRANPLTSQQQGILSTLNQRGMMNQVMSMMSPANQQAFNSMPQEYKDAALVMAMQGFLGAPSGNLDSVPQHKPKNKTLYTNRLGIDLHAKATQDVSVNVRLLAYKTFGSQDDSAVTNGGSTPYFADRVGTFDGTLGHIPSTSLLNVDRAYATWSNIAEQPIWFSVGRRPSTNGAPSNLRLNNERPGTGGTPALLVDYAFDGMTVGWAPDIEALPGAYAKICYGRGFESGFETPGNSIEDTDMLGIAVVPIDTDPLRVWLQWNRGFNIFDFPVMSNTAFGNTAPSTNLGSIDWYGAGMMSTLKNIGPGRLNFFLDGGLSRTHPNDNVSMSAGFQGLGTGEFFSYEAPSDKTGWAGYMGARYDIERSRTKIGVEYNHGSKNWITFAPAADDLWTSKLGTRGNVYEAYLIQELNLKPISSRLSKAFFRLGYQHYDFDYTGSNNWVGAPVKISSIQATDIMLLTPLKKAQDIYATFEVKF
jgi:hypothetical protein